MSYKGVNIIGIVNSTELTDNLLKSGFSKMLTIKVRKKYMVNV